MMEAPRSLALARQLVQFDTTSRGSNLALIDWVRDHLAAQGVASRLTFDDARAKANLFASIGDKATPGVVLSAHTDVVPVDGQAWSVDPFAAITRDERLFGRGTADMKAFLAIMLAAVPDMLAKPLGRPIHLALSYDEEVGCIGVGRMIRDMQDIGVAPGICIVGEPTMMKVVTGHKGKLAVRARVSGREAHSALAPYAVNALDYAAEIVVALRRIQRERAERGPFHREYDPPYTTLHAGVLHAGTALNIVPRDCSSTSRSATCRRTIRMRCSPGCSASATRRSCRRCAASRRRAPSRSRSGRTIPACTPRSRRTSSPTSSGSRAAAAAARSRSHRRPGNSSAPDSRR